MFLGIVFFCVFINDLGIKIRICKPKTFDKTAKVNFEIKPKPAIFEFNVGGSFIFSLCFFSKILNDI